MRIDMVVGESSARDPSIREGTRSIAVMPEKCSPTIAPVMISAADSAEARLVRALASVRAG